MKRLLSPAVAFLFILLCLPEFATTMVAQGDNPIMIIRCRNFDEEALKSDNKPENQSKMMTGCPPGYSATADGGCVPICDAPWAFNPATGYCEHPDPSGPDRYCPGELFFPGSIAECDPCLGDGAGSTTEDFLTYDPSLGACYKSCFDGEVTFDPPTVNCDSPEPNGNVAVELCFRSSDPTMPLQDGQQVPISDIANCLNELGNEYIDLLPTVISSTDNYGFGTALNGEICIEFFANPNEPIIINLTNQVEPLTIPVNCVVIPSMGQWALMIFALILSSLGLVFITRRKTA